MANGEITNYIVKASLIYDDPELLQQRNYCRERMLSLRLFLSVIFSVDKFSALGKGEEKSFAIPPTPHKPITHNTPNDCVCPEDDEYNYSVPWSNGRSERAEQVINFENEMQNIIYVK